MRKVKLISAYFLLVLMLFSSLGVSFYLHQCGCRHSLLVNIGVGFSTPGHEDCCNSCSSKPVAEEHGFNFGKKSCCSDFVFFYLLPVTQDNAGSQFIHNIVIQTIKSIATTIETIDISLIEESVPFVHFPPPRLPGRKLIYFFQQIKIPFPSCQLIQG